MGGGLAKSDASFNFPFRLPFSLEMLPAALELHFVAKFLYVLIFAQF